MEGGVFINKLPDERLKARLLICMKTKAYRPMRINELAEALELEASETNNLQTLLDHMEKEGLVMKTRNQRYGIPEKMGYMSGILKGHAKGYGFVDPENTELPSAYIPANSMRGALHMDRVLVRIVERAEEGQKAEGEITAVLERGILDVPGTYEKTRRFGFVVPDDPRINTDIFIPGDRGKGVPNGYKVVCRITQWGEKRRNPEGKIIEVLGRPDDPETDMRSIIKRHGLRESFGKSVMKEAGRIKQSVEGNDIQKRADYRDRKVFTIDGPDAKDLDDAISVMPLGNGVIQLAVHIADVAHYVKQGSKMDQEAYERGTSVYLVDRVLPMLPTELSNGICSLNPRQDRLTLTVLMDIDQKGNVIHHDIQESVINSRERMVYDDVSDILENKSESLMQRYQHLMDELMLMEELYRRLRDKRDARGSIDFHFAESKIVLDDKGHPVDIQLENRRRANRLIEEFMLVCNETVAEHHFWLKQPFIYRVHEDPDEEKINQLVHFVHHFGYTLPGYPKDLHPKMLQQLLAAADGKMEAPVINTMMLRSLKKARYSAHHGTHFGLAARYYTHFTSPIRRYPDLAIHRMIKSLLHARAENAERDRDKLTDALEKTAIHASEQERTAEEAERETVDLKKTVYMAEHVGNEYHGLISGITSFGIFVELENTVEGLIRLRDLEDDYYIYDQQHLTLTGERSKKVFRIGQSVRIRVAGVNLQLREIDFILIEP